MNYLEFDGPGSTLVFLHGGNVAGWIKDDVLTDVDLQGHNMDVFAKDWFEEALRYGLMSRPIPARIPCLRHVPAYDPFAPVTGPGNGGFRGL